jgi:2-amino-4-hydroxy-6-hydroxymethyldihydropteridine diphosphokinase
MKQHTVFLALGTNTGDTYASIKKALELLQGRIDIIKVASTYESKPWGFEKQDNFLNTALKGTTILDPEELLAFIQEVEKRIGRKKRFQNGPREIDIDILFFENIVMNTTHLQIPHPKLHKRDFVLLPLIDIEPSYIHPQLNTSLQALYNRIPPNERFVIRKLYE